MEGRFSSRNLRTHHALVTGTHLPRGCSNTHTQNENYPTKTREKGQEARLWNILDIVQFSAQVRDISLHQNVQTRSGVYPASNSKGTTVHSHGFTHLYLWLSLRKNGATPQYVIMAWIGSTLLSNFKKYTQGWWWWGSLSSPSSSLPSSSEWIRRRVGHMANLHTLEKIIISWSWRESNHDSWLCSQQPTYYTELSQRQRNVLCPSAG